MFTFYRILVLMSKQINFLKETIMEMYNVKVNETHMCVLRKEENEDRVKVDFVELKFKHQDQLNELKRMADNDNRSVLDMQDYVKGSSLRRLSQDFDFCSCLSDSYQWISCLQPISFTDYRKEIDEYEKKGDKAGKEAYARDQRQRYYNRIVYRVLPAMLEDLSYDLYKDPSVLAYSHRRVGWASPAFNLNDDIRVVYLTNFGYGSASYFFLQIYYKGIGILPYSQWIHYRKACSSEIIRYTRRYHLANEEWMKTMFYTADVYNDAVSHPDSFVQNNILNEVEEMVSGLETIKNAHKYCVQESFFNPSNITIEGDNLTRFKGEKISGALDFLDQLQTLAPITDRVNTYILRIMTCNLSLVPELQKAISDKNEFLVPILKNIEKEQPKWDELSAKYARYNTMRSELAGKIAKEEAFSGKSWGAIWDERDTRFEKEYPEYVPFKKEYDAEQNIYSNLCAKRDKAQSFIEEIQSYLDKIEKHKDYMVENNIAA